MAGLVSPFTRRLVAVAVVGFAARVAYGLATKDAAGFGGDALWYHLVANNLADGHGYVAPFRVLAGDEVRFGIGSSPAPTAFHLPLFSTVLAAFSLVGLDSQTAHMIVGCALGAAHRGARRPRGAAVGGARGRARGSLRRGGLPGARDERLRAAQRVAHRPDGRRGAARGAAPA